MKLFSKIPVTIFVFTLLITLIITAPATLLNSLATQATQGRLLLTNIHGSIWQGTATPVIIQKDNVLMPLQQLHWKIHVWPLWTGKLNISLWPDDVPQSSAMQAIFSADQIELKHLQLTIPAAALSEISPHLRLAQLQGKIQITSEHLLLSSRSITGTANADWLDAGSTLSPINPLGVYHLTLNGIPGNDVSGNNASGKDISGTETASGLNIALTTTSGALILKGNGNWSPAQGLKFHGTAQAAGSHQASLGALLGYMGRQESPGVYTLTLITR
ncbi:MAG: type II secretion system protein N [Candidatus Nitrotoga sp.]